MRVVRIPYHLVVDTVRHHPLVLGVLDLKFVDELCLEVIAILMEEKVRVLSKSSHPAQMKAGLFMLAEGVFILALLLAHLAVVLMLAQSHLNF